MKPVRTKADFVRRYAQGEFGNASPTWATYRDWLTDWQDDGWEDRRYHLRNRIAGGATYYNITGENVPDTFKRLLAEGVDGQNIYVSEMAPTELTLIQGEVRRSTYGLELYYSRYVAPMRESLARGGKSVGGILSVTLLKHFLDNSSWEWLNYLLDEYPDHVVEFSTYGKQWGTVPGMNTVFWEVRLY